MAASMGVPAPVPLGRPIGGTTAWVADARLRPVPFGVAGELVIGGDGLARGYLGRPSLTARQFEPDSSAGSRPGGEPGARRYRSGDLARMGPDGRLHFLGRLDRQVKVRGFRVEPGEVEGALRRCPGVGAAAVVLRESALAAFVAPAAPGSGSGSEGGPDPEAIRRRLVAELPAFMLPSTVTVLDELPLGPTGKVDRKALAALSSRPAPSGRERPAAGRPRSELERTLAGLWARALDPESDAESDPPGRRPEEIDPEASFFDLGGHSLGLARLHGMLTAELGVEIPVADLFDHPSVAAIARH
jgi:acyl-coenzyme A synthetase/AMP-(fatty) acid ligase/acyl carrier protein